VQQPGIPTDVADFLARHIRAVEQLEVLLLLHDNPSREWTADQVANHQYSHATSSARQLERLASSQFLAARKDGATAHYRYGPASAADAYCIDRLAATYRERRVAVLTSIASGPLDNVFAFADAFRLRKEDK